MLISWNITKLCNLKCRHCYRDAGEKDKNELSTREAFLLLKEIHKAGFRIVILSGGEPLMREDVYDLINYAKRIGLTPVLGSNGTLIDEKILKNLRKAGLKRIGVSLDSIIPVEHDEFRGVKGAFERVKRAIALMEKLKFEFQIHTTVTKYNYKYIPLLIDYVLNLKVAAYHIFFLIPSGRGKDEKENLIDLNEYYRLLNHILSLQKKIKLEIKPVCAPQFVPLAKKKGLEFRFQRGCLAGISYCCILPNGDIHPCPYLPLKIANIREDRFSKIWEKHDIFLKLRSLNYKGKCKDCQFKEVCGGCRARAYIEYNDYMEEDPYCVFRAVG